MAIMTDFSCIYNDSDDECYKCTRKGYIFSCRDCEYYTDFFGNHKPKNDDFSTKEQKNEVG